tara:strand:- start:8919 stop:9197 length:279 start_codon:yes stop_codon:yes gene_type:complete
MSSKRKKSKNKSRAKSSLGISRKKNYTKNSPITQDTNDNQVSSELSSNDPVAQSTQNSETTLSYPYLKREIFQIGSTFTLISLLLVGFAFFI